MSKKLNGYAKWIMVVIAVGTIAYNTIVTQVVLKNDMKHLTNDVAKGFATAREDRKEIKQSVKFLTSYLLGKK